MLGLQASQGWAFSVAFGFMDNLHGMDVCIVATAQVEALYSARAVPILLSGLFVAACQFFSTHFVHEVRLFDPRGAIGRPVGPHTLVHVTPHTMVDFGTPIVVPLGSLFHCQLIVLPLGCVVDDIHPSHVVIFTPLGI